MTYGKERTLSSSVELRPQNIMRGVSLIIVAALSISIQDVVFKLFSSELTLWQIFALRGVLAIPLLLAVLWVRGAHQGSLRAALGKWPLLRSVFIAASLLAFYAAIPFLSLSTVGAANYIAPIFVTLLSAYAIREPVGPLGCESWAHSGIAEFFGGEQYVVFMSGSGVTRQRISNGVTTVLQMLSPGDVCSISISPTSNRWYSQFEAQPSFASVFEGAMPTQVGMPIHCFTRSCISRPSSVT